MPKPVENITTDAEDEVWDQLFDTDAMRACSCVGCNHYLPDYDPDRTCEVIGLIYKIIEARETANA